MGATTSTGLSPLTECLENPDPSLSQAAARELNGLSNGSMMRSTPLAVWAQNLSLEELEQTVQADTSLMHSNKAMWDLITAYCLVIKTLIKNAG